MINKTKTKILTLSVVSVVGLAAITVLASNANNALVNNALELQGEVKQNTHLELKELKLIENPTKPGVTSQTDVTWKMDDNELVATKEAKGTTNTVKGQWTLSIWGQENSITESESFILWGKSNTLNAKTSIIGASNSIKGEEGEGDTVLGSSDVTFTWSNNIVQSANGTNIKGSGNIVLSTNQVNITTNNTMAIGNKAIVSGQGSFVFNGTTESLKSTQEFTTLISGNNGMIINTNKRNTPNVGLTVNWGIKVGQITNLDKPWSLITQDNCLQLKSTEKGAISLKCRGIERDVEEALKTPKCWRNAANYHYTDSEWTGTANSDFCAQGTFEGDKSFRSEEQRKTPTGIWSYADRGFTYDFTICFRDKDPLCAPKNLSKTWRCKTDQGNAVVCEANLQIKPMQCAANQHLEDEGQTNGTTPQGRKCLPNQKNVSCDNKGINKANGSFTNENVSVTRDANNRTYTAPSKCTLKCNEGFKLNEAKTACMSSTKQVSCDEISRLPSNATWKDATVTATRNPQKNSWDTPKCDFECKTGYYYDNNDGEPKCLKIPFSCEPWDDVTNATLVWSGNNGLVGVDNQTKTLIWTWENPTTTCQYKCKTGYERKKSSNAQRYYCAKICPPWKHLYENNCVLDTQSKSCVRTWTLPSNATWKGATVTATRNSQKNSWDIPKCDFKCNRWYNKSSDGKSCVVAETPRCTGTIPNATLGSGQDLWLTGTQQITLVKTIDPNKKCQAVCNSEFELKNSNCVRKEAQCKVWQYKDGNTCKDKTLKITLKNSKISAPFPQEVCTKSDENFIHLNVWVQEKRLSACTTWSFIFTGDISSYDFQWKVKKTDKIVTRRITFWMNWGPYEDATSVDVNGFWMGLNLQGGQSWTDFTTGEVVIENTNMPIPPTTAPKDERFNIDLNEWWYRKPEAETLEKIREKYAIPQDINHIQCRLTNHKDVGFYKGPTWTEIFDSNNSRDIKEELKRAFYNDYLNKKLEKTLIRWSSLYHWSYDWYRGRRRSLSYNDHEWGESDFYVWYVEVKDENVILHRWPVTCDPEIWYIGPKLGEDKFKLNPNFDFSIRLGTKEGTVTYDKK